MKRFLLHTVIIISILFALRACGIARQAISFEKLFSSEEYKNDDISCTISCYGKWKEYYLEKKTLFTCYQEPYDLRFAFFPEKPGISSIKINSFLIKYNDLSLNENTSQYNGISKDFKYTKMGYKIASIQVDKIINLHAPFTCKVDITVFYRNGEEKHDVFEVNVTTHYKGNRSYAIIDALMSV
ncbi:MAG: hypothetical protein AB1454_13310 [Candidatus Auribacterota bacterium]